MKIRPVAELFLADGRTDIHTDRQIDRQAEQADMTKLIIVLRNFLNSSKNGKCHVVSVNCNIVTSDALNT
jgi:hypothetical protein